MIFRRHIRNMVSVGTLFLSLRKNADSPVPSPNYPSLSPHLGVELFSSCCCVLYGKLSPSFYTFIYSPLTSTSVQGRIIHKNIVNCLGESARDLPAKTEQVWMPSRVRRTLGVGRPLDAASHTSPFVRGHCQVGPQVCTWWFGINLGGFLLFVGL